MITINENFLPDLEKELVRNSYEEWGSGFSFMRIYQLGKSWNKYKIDSRKGTIGIIRLKHHIKYVENLEWELTLYPIAGTGEVMFTKEVPDVLLDQIGKSFKVLYESIRKLNVSINMTNKSFFNPGRDGNEIMGLSALSGSKDNEKVKEDVLKIVKNLPSIARRMDSIMAVRRKGRVR